MQQPSIVEHATGVPGFRLVRARQVTFAEPRTIIHADFAFKLTTAGRGAPLRYRGTDHEPCLPGQLSVFQPFEPLQASRCPHTTSFTTLLVDPQLLDTADKVLNCSQMTFHSPHFHGAAVANGLLALTAELDKQSSTTDVELQLTELLETLLAPPELPQPLSVHPAALRAREIILDSLTDNVPVDQLERECELSRFYLIRVFRKYYGLPPREFRTRARVALARRLLARGSSQVETAHAVGFCDQSHFHRHFRRLTGLSPGRFQRELGLRGR